MLPTSGWNLVKFLFCKKHCSENYWKHATRNPDIQGALSNTKCYIFELYIGNTAHNLHWPEKLASQVKMCICFWWRNARHILTRALHSLFYCSFTTQNSFTSWSLSFGIKFSSSLNKVCCWSGILDPTQVCHMPVWNHHHHQPLWERWFWLGDFILKSCMCKML